jgi:hypothetical protein
MTTDALVMDVSQDWATAGDVQQRFMQPPGPTIDALSYSARCRQVRALGVESGKINGSIRAATVSWTATSGSPKSPKSRICAAGIRPLPEGRPRRT